MDVSVVTAVSIASLQSVPYDGTIDEGRIDAFLAALAQSGFSGDIRRGGADSIVNATDNSIYQVLPAAVIYPATAEDINTAVRLAAGNEFGPVPLTARGGGTGTNGQSLTRGVTVDTSRHLNRVLDFDLQGQTVAVEPGVVLAQLNAFLAQHGLFFPPMVSTATRATIGGMVATDASGKGSRIYGKTSDYILSMDVVLSDGTDLRIEPTSGQELEAFRASDTIAGRACRQVIQTVSEHAEEIARVFPQMNRGLTGYNLQKALTADGVFSLHRVLAGSEGTLALTKAVRLRVMKKPAYQALVVVRYSSFEAGLSHVNGLIGFDPVAVEIIDEKVIGLARQDIIWDGIGSVLGREGTVPVEAMNVIEFAGDSAEAVERQVAALDAALSPTGGGVVDHTVVKDRDAIGMLWSLREKSVGLMGRANGLRQGIAFVEDAAVPPEVLPEFIREFRAVLDRHALAYGMYGHADVGCLHVRPIVNMQAPKEAALIRPISDEVAALAKRYGGLLWGEHGRGYRGEYSQFFFGDVLTPSCARSKQPSIRGTYSIPASLPPRPAARRSMKSIRCPCAVNLTGRSANLSAGSMKRQCFATAMASAFPGIRPMACVRPTRQLAIAPNRRKAAQHCCGNGRAFSLRNGRARLLRSPCLKKQSAIPCRPACHARLVRANARSRSISRR